MKEQLKFSDVPWELRHCCNCDSCYWSLFMAKTFFKMSFLLKMMLLRKFGALENVASYCHEAHCPSKSRRSFNATFSRRIWERERQHHLSTTRNFRCPPKSHCVQWGLLQAEKRWAALAGAACGHMNCCLPTHRRKLGHPGASPLCPGLLTQYLGTAHHPQHQLLGQGYGEGLQSEQAHKGGFWAHRACLLGVTVTS